MPVAKKATITTGIPARQPRRAILNPAAQPEPVQKRRSRSRPVYITAAPDVCAGEPVIAGTRLPVHQIITLLAEERAVYQIVSQAYPQLSQEQVKAALEYSAKVVRSDELLIP